MAQLFKTNKAGFKTEGSLDCFQRRLTAISSSHTNLAMNSISKLFFVSLTLIPAGCSSLDCCKPDSKGLVLFDGKSADAFRGYKLESFPDKAWKIEDGTLKTIVGGEVVDLITKETFDNFDLRLDWRVSPGGNSGVIYNVSEKFPASYNTGPEMQVLDDAKHKDGANPKTSAGSLYALIAPKNKKLKPVGAWNHARLLVNGNHVEHWLNGSKIVEYELESAELSQLIADSKFNSMAGFAKEKSGHIVLQHHRDEVWYRNIKIRRW